MATLLNNMGANSQAGTNEIESKASEKLHGCRRSIIPESKLEAGTYLAMAAAIEG